MDKLIKIYILKDERTGLDIPALKRHVLEKYEDSTTTIHDGYFITKEQLETIAYRAMGNAEHRLLTGDKHTETVMDILKDLGIIK